VLTVDEAFKKFKSRLEVLPTDEQEASSRQKKIRKQVGDELDVADDFLTGAYVRDTKTRPLRDVDIFVVLGDGEQSYRDKHPREILNAVRAVLVPHYEDDRVCTDRRCVRVDFGVSVIDDISDEVVSFDVVPAFAAGEAFEIPDDRLGEWIPTNPRVHKSMSTDANKALSGEWKPLVKMAKKWNQHNGGPVEPSFLIEVMALKLIEGPWTGSYPYELRQFFSSAADRIDEGWPDPAETGPDVSDVLDSDPTMMGAARSALRTAEAVCTEALRLDRAGRTSEALGTWQTLFGPSFAKS
jgi:hypothetical protein